MSYSVIDGLVGYSMVLSLFAFEVYFIVGAKCFTVRERACCRSVSHQWTFYWSC